MECTRTTPTPLPREPETDLITSPGRFLPTWGVPGGDTVPCWLPEKRKVTGSTPVPTTDDGQAKRLVIGLLSPRRRHVAAVCRVPL
jgi:hypothetical protein